MKFINKRTESTESGYLKPGDIFLYNNDPFIKTPYVSGSGMHLNCVNLRTGEPELITVKTLIIPVEAELTVY